MEGKFWEIRTHQDISVITHTLVIPVAHGNFTGHSGFQYNWETVQFDQHIFKTLKQYQNVFFGASCVFFLYAIFDTFLANEPWKKTCYCLYLQPSLESTFTYSWYIRKPDGHALELAIVLIDQEVIITCIFIVNLKSENIPYLIM